MSSNTLSVVLEKLIRRLCLDNFPCRDNSWRSVIKEGAETEETDALLDLLSCPHSPWKTEASWSPQASALRKIAVLRSGPLDTDFVYSYFTVLRIVDKDVSIIDDGLLRFSKLEELVLSANRIQEIPAENLPSCLKILELCANQVSTLNSFTSCPPPPHLQHLGLSSNRLGSEEEIPHFTGRFWPRLVCLDLSDCEFQDQRTLLEALSTLPCLRSLGLEGNPFTLASCYPGFTVDRLPQLSCLDSLWISPEERRCFRGLTEMRDLITEQASATVKLGRMRGILDPVMSMYENAPDFPLITYSYYISYGFFSFQTAVDQKSNGDFGCDPAVEAQETETRSSDKLPSNRNQEGEKETSRSNVQEETPHTEETCVDAAQVSRHSTSKLAWSECMDFSDTHTYTVSDLRGFKKFLNQGLRLQIEEEKVLSWPAPSEDVSTAKPNQAGKDKKSGKGKETPNKSGSNKDKSKDKKKKPAQDLVRDPPITRVVASVHIPLQNLLRRGQKVDVLCNFGVLHTEPEGGTTPTCAKGNKMKEEKKKEEKETKQSGNRQKNSAASKGKGKEKAKSKVDDQKDNPTSTQLEPVTVELTVELEKWHSTSEALQSQTSH